jgi:Tol biopolymer transport system component
MRSASVVMLAVAVASGCGSTEDSPVAPDFGNEAQVTLLGYDGHAMEPSISRDGHWLFFNSLNDASDTSIYYARRVDEKTFQVIGKLGGVNGDPPHLDAVPSMDMNGNFYFISTRNYPNDYRNVLTGTFSNDVVSNVHRVDGDFYVERAGWIVMDVEISPDGSLLTYVNARFVGGPLPVEARLGVAHLVEGRFVKDPNSELLMANPNKKGIVYAPSMSLNGRELFFTAIRGSGTRMYVARRDSLSVPFGESEAIDVKGSTPEGPSLTLDARSLYFHKRVGGKYTIFKLARLTS